MASVVQESAARAPMCPVDGRRGCRNSSPEARGKWPEPFFPEGLQAENLHARSQAVLPLERGSPSDTLLPAQRHQTVAVCYGEIEPGLRIGCLPREIANHLQDGSNVLRSHVIGVRSGNDGERQRMWDCNKVVRSIR